MVKQNAELRNRIRECVEDFAETVRQEVDKVPKRRIVSGQRFKREEEFINQPSEIITLYSPRQNEFFQETAEWMCNSKKGFDSRDQDTEAANVSYYVNQLFNFAGTVMDYSGGYEVTEEGFNKAYEDHWLPKYETGLDVFEILVPMHLFNIPGDEDVTIELSPEFELRNRRHNFYRIESLRISPLTDSERRGVLSSSAVKPESNPIDGCEYKIQARIAAKEEEASLYDPGKEVGNRVATALRLFNYDPKSGDLIIGTTFRREPNWLDFREDIPDLTVIGDSHRDRTQEREAYFLSSNSVSEFAEFWNRHCCQIRIDKDGQFARSIHRFNQPLSKKFYEDQILDCLIGLEGLLLRGVNSSSSITFRLKLRGGQILRDKLPYERDYIHKFLQDIYSIRGDVIHENKYLAESLDRNNRLKIIGDEFDHPKELVDETRQFMGAAIVAYMDIVEETGLSIDEIGIKMDEASLDADSTELFD